MNNRVSKPVVMEILKKYLDDQLAWKIFEDIEKADEKEAASEIGMTYGEWKERFDERLKAVVWAADTHAGFGKAGDPVYGNADDLKIVMIKTDYKGKTLCLWDDVLGDWRKGADKW